MRQTSSDPVRSCQAKARHDTYYGAYIALRKAHANEDPTLDVYACEFCRAYHLGHGELGDRIALRVRLVNLRWSATDQIYAWSLVQHPPLRLLKAEAERGEWSDARARRVRLGPHGRSLLVADMILQSWGDLLDQGCLHGFLVGLGLDLP